MPEFASDDRRGQLYRPSGSPGEYEILAVLGVPGVDSVTQQLDFATDPRSGDSLLRLPSDGVGLQVEIVPVSPSESGLTIQFCANKEGRLSAAQLILTASSFNDAGHQAHDAIMPLLSSWCVEYDVAIDVVALLILERETGSQRLRTLVLGAEKVLDIGTTNPTSPQHRALLATYREATNAINSLVKALWYAKVIEGIRKQRSVRVANAQAAGDEPTEPSERVPTDLRNIGLSLWESTCLEEYAGKRFTKISADLRTVIRNAIAHLDPNGTSLVGDRYDDVVAAEQAIPVLKYMSRVMLRDELRHTVD